MVETFLILLLCAFFAGMTALVIQHYAPVLRLIDLPNARSSHTLPTPRGGGLAFVMAFMLGLFLLFWVKGISIPALWSFLIGALLIVGTGFLDDMHNLSAKWRFLVQAISITLLLVGMGGMPALQIGHWQLGQGLFYQFFVGVGLIWLVNLYNFMDGIDGLATVEALTVCVGVLGHFLWSGNSEPLSLIVLLLIACMLGFLPLNWSPARLFMGDAGSNFLGFLFAYLIIFTVQTDVCSIWGWMILLGYFAVDATFTLLRRVARGKRWYEAHRTHAYQHLSQRWNSHAKVSTLVAVINLVWLFPLSLLAMCYPDAAIVCVLVAWLPLIGICVAVSAGT